MATRDDRYEQFHPETREAWRDWLAAHHAAAPGVWLVSYKRASGKPRVAYDDAVEEALCFGWIDSRPATLDAARAMLLFTPRKPGSPWSKLNKERIARLTAQGRLAPAGLAAVAAAQADGSWTAYDAIEALEVPQDLAAALAREDGGEAGFAAFSATDKKQLLWWVASAKRPETRAQRLAAVAEGAARRRNPLNWRANARSRATDR